MHEYRSPALKRLNCLLSEMDAAYHEAALRQGQNDSTSRILYALCELGLARVAACRLWRAPV